MQSRAREHRPRRPAAIRSGRRYPHCPWAIMTASVDRHDGEACPWVFPEWTGQVVPEPVHQFVNSALGLPAHVESKLPC